MSAFNGAHTTFPMLDMPIAEFAKDKDGKTRDIVMIVDEAILNECGEPRQMVWFADVTVENRPMMISSYTVPEASGSFCERGGRFGSHSSNESMAPVYYKKMAFIAFFNAGVRALDIRDPYHPKEVGYFIPSITAATDKRCVTDRRQGALQGRDPDQQCRDRRARLHLHRRPRQYRPAYSGTDRPGARRRRPAVRTDDAMRWPVDGGRALWRSARCPAPRPISMRRDCAGKKRWREIAWPFPRDGWPAGRAFRCDAAACGDEVEALCAAQDRLLQLRQRRRR